MSNFQVFKIFKKHSTYNFLILAFLLAAVLLTVKVARLRQELRQRAEVGATISLIPEKTSVVVSEEFDVNLQLETGDTQVGGVDVTINFDTTYLEGTSFVSGSFMPNILVSPTIENGSARIVVGNVYGANPVTGTGVIGVLRFKALSPISATTISFDAQTKANDLATGTIQLALVPATIEITEGTINADTTLSILPSNPTFNERDTFYLPIHINTGTNQISSADLTVIFDENYLELKNFTISGFFQNITSGPSIDAGVAKMVLATSDNQPKQGVDSVAILEFYAKQSGTTTVYLDGSTRVYTQGGQNVIKNLLSSQVTISSNPLPTPTPPSYIGGTCVANRPGVPTGVTAVALNTSQILVSWTGVPNITHYGIVYGLSSGVYVYGAANVGNVTSFNVSGLKSGTRYYFALFAVNDCAPSEYSAQASVLTQSAYGGTPIVYATPKASIMPSALPEPTETTAVFEPINPNDDSLSFLSPKSRTSPIPSLNLEPAASPSPAGEAGDNLFLYNLFWVIIAILLLLVIIFILYRNSRERES